MNEHFPGEEGGEGPPGGAVWTDGRMWVWEGSIRADSWRAGLEGSVESTRGVEGQRHKE